MNQVKKFSKVLLKPHLILFVLVTTSLSGCVSVPDPEPPLQTRILEVKVEPNPVVVGDTATFTCIIVDSLDESFQYSWFLEADGILFDTVTTRNTIKWKAPDSSAIYNHSVEPFNNDQNAISPSKSFPIEVTNN